MIEVEQKYRIVRQGEFLATLQRLGFREAEQTEHHVDTYFNHPCRDFSESGEAFRVRRINGRPFMTYKGAKLAGQIKARREIELAIGGDRQDGKEFEEALELLGFRKVATVTKTRRSFKNLPHSGSEEPAQVETTVLVDRAEGLGEYAELERIVATESGVNPARKVISELARQLGLGVAESRSYLTMWLEKHGVS